MNIYSPADDRAIITLEKLINPFINDINNSTNIKNIVDAIVTNFPYGFAHQIELRMRFQFNTAALTEGRINTDVRNTIIDIAKHVLLQRICDDLPMLHDAEGNRQYYYMREDVISWYNSDALNVNYFAVPDTETITIELHYPDTIETSNLTLNEDQIVGISYAMTKFIDNFITLRSSITNDFVNVNDIAEHALIYRLPITLASEELKRPYRVDIIQSNLVSITLHFNNPEFMQGIISVAQWHNLPNNGKDFLWTKLFQLTREGLIALEF